VHYEQTVWLSRKLNECRTLIHGGANRPELKVKIAADLNVAMQLLANYRKMQSAVESENWETVIHHSTEGDKVLPKRKPDALRKLVAARAHWELGQLAATERMADRAIAAGRKNGDWRRGQVRALAVALGAAAAIKRGDAETALRFFAFAMRADPDTPLFKIPYKAGGLLRTSTRPTFNLFLLLRASI